MNKKHLVLVEDSSYYPRVENIDVESIYKPVPKIMRFIRYLHHMTGLFPSLKKKWLGKWRHNLNKYDKAIIFDSIFDYTPLVYMQKHSANLKLDFCYRNRIHERIRREIIKRNPEELKRLFGCRVWSYSEDDCAKYNLIHYNQFHLLQESISSDKNEIIYDVYFIGNDKGRLEELKKFDKILKKMGVRTKIEIVPSPGIKYNSEDSEYLVSPRPYSEVIKSVLQSRCIIDWIGNINRGLTFRGLEAMVLHKKLITNFVDILNMDFYNPTNIFIVGEDSIDRLLEFVYSDFDDSISPCTDKYSFKSFCKRVFKE